MEGTYGLVASVRSSSAELMATNSCLRSRTGFHHGPLRRLTHYGTEIVRRRRKPRTPPSTTAKKNDDLDACGRSGSISESVRKRRVNGRTGLLGLESVHWKSAAFATLGQRCRVGTGGSPCLETKSTSTSSAASARRADRCFDEYTNI